MKIESSRFLLLLFFLLIHIHERKYSGGHETFVKLIKNVGGGWQLFSKTLVGKDLKIVYFK